MRNLEVIYDYAPIDINGYFDTATERAVSTIQYINRLPETGRVDRYTWDAIVYDNEKFKDWDS